MIDLLFVINPSVFLRSFSLGFGSFSSIDPSVFLCSLPLGFGDFKG